MFSFSFHFISVIVCVYICLSLCVCVIFPMMSWQNYYTCWISTLTRQTKKNPKNKQHSRFPSASIIIIIIIIYYIIRIDLMNEWMSFIVCVLKFIFIYCNCNCNFPLNFYRLNWTTSKYIKWNKCLLYIKKQI